MRHGSRVMAWCGPHVSFIPRISGPHGFACVNQSACSAQQKPPYGDTHLAIVDARRKLFGLDRRIALKGGGQLLPVKPRGEQELRNSKDTHVQPFPDSVIPSDAVDTSRDNTDEGHAKVLTWQP